METKWTKWYAMTSHVIAYRSLELLFGTHTFHFNCLFEDFNCVFTQIRCLSRVLSNGLGGDTFTRNMTDGRRTDFDTKLIYPFFSKEKRGYNKHKLRTTQEEQRAETSTMWSVQQYILLSGFHTFEDDLLLLIT